MTRNEVIQLSNDTQKFLIKIEKFGIKTFYQGLVEATKRVVPYFNANGDTLTLFYLDDLVDQSEIEKAYKEFVKESAPKLLIKNLTQMIKLEKNRRKDITPLQQLGVTFRNEQIIKQTANIANDLHLAKNVVNVTEYTKQLIKESIERGIAENLTKEQIARNITKITKGEISKMRAMRIARTETTYVNSQTKEILGQNIPFKQEKRWIPRIDGRERPEHGAMMSSDWIKNEELFKVGGESLKYPGDPNNGASAGNLVNCRCSYVTRVTEESANIEEQQGLPTPINYFKELLKSLLLSKFFS